MADYLRRCRLLLALVFLLILDHHALALAGEAVLTWDPNSEGNLAGYRVYVGLLPGVYSPPINVGRVTSWTVPNLTEGLTYYFAVTAYDTNGKESGFSNEARKTIPPLNDVIAPLISSVTNSNRTLNSALITWGTDEPADTRIEYGTTTAYGLTTPLVSSLVTVHSQTLSNLLPGTLYHYRVLSRDAAGNLATSADQIFTTLSDTTTPTVPGNVSGAALSTTQINLTWSASTDNVGVAGYRIYRNGVQVATRTTLTYSDGNLTPDTVYSYRVAAYDAAGNLSAQSAAASVRTLAPADTAAPVISGMGAINITAGGALISWSTNEPADTQIEYGTTTAFGSFTAIVPTLVTAHAQSLSGLLPATLYHYRVRSRDAAGNLAVSGSGSFTTAVLPDTTAPSVPTNVGAAAVSSSQVQLSWSASTDNVGVAGYRIYRNGVQIASSALRTYLNSGLAANTVYSYAVAAYDAGGNLSPASAAVSVTTLPLMPTVSQSAASGVTATSATLSGSVNPSGATTSAWFEYGTTTAYGSGTTPVTLSAANTISADLTLLASGTTYHFRLVARNAGGTTFGPNTSFNTPSPPASAPAPSPSGPITGYSMSEESYAWAEAPTPLTFSGDDNAISLSLPFSFPFYSQSYQQIYISTNGLLTFGSANTAYVPQPVQNPVLPNAFIAPFWRDLYVGLRQISIASSDSEFVISFNEVRDLCCSTSHTFQVVLRPDGTILFQYGAIVLNVPTTSGIENQDGSAGVPLLSAAPNTAFRFTPNTAQAPPPTADTTPPVISGIGVGGVTSSGAVLSWSTNEPADTQVEYGTTTAYGTSTGVVSTLVTSHAQSLTGLLPATLYHYRVRSRDAAGNLAVSNNGSFTTAAAPDTSAPSVPTGLTGAAVSSSQINLAWNSSTDNVGVSGYRVYRNGVQIATVSLPSYSNTGLAAGTTYSYTVAAFDAAGNVSAQSAAVSAATPASNSSTTLVLNPTGDTFISGNSTAYGSWETLNTYTWPANKIANAALMQFNLSGLPAGAVIQSATLTLALVEADATADAAYNIGVHRILNRNADLTRATGLTYDGVNGWTANSCCFNNVPLAQADISAAYDTRAVDKTLGQKSWNVTAMVQEWLNSPSSNNGMLLNSDATKGADRYRFFASMEHPTASSRPSLSITYRMP
ncbi:fibronectin type III domain-containing protein [Candidatus Manganitrophus noduliformans]|uniref:DNRLRE domain-containing protein n=1 Tax=Candidatus Manganitrophus noduliformans TaxID=2606439 RepID=A0A7X6DQ69_9BACT|nr:fibronectin type III domain-containing protein [Candidatus Manganitrophus noduliformans]NKE71368.1 DNRLRE domain-containing protein [Candidatus Manganitrophus noduliformans]